MSERKHYDKPIMPGVPPTGAGEGIACPNPDCGCRHFWVVSTRQTHGGVRRQRECRNCGARFATFEATQ